MLMIKKILIITFFVISLTGKSHSLFVIRDGEIEEFLQELTLPIIQKSGLESKNIKIYIVNDPAVNAFVSNGQNIFIVLRQVRKRKMDQITQQLNQLV